MCCNYIELDFSLDSNRVKEIFYYNRQEQRKRHQQEQRDTKVLSSIKMPSSQNKLDMEELLSIVQVQRRERTVI
jgi:hypothetical protein